ncbi:MAG: hypothetical protein QNJ87_04920 [Gammaproteobacteria bacterium]|nr:hypothetical protein [Gammaproteobacteria bacterium]
MPLLDMAARRAREAARPVDAVERLATRGDIDAVGAGAVPAERVAPAALMAALPVLDMAARRAFEAARPADAVDVPAAGARTSAAGAAVAVAACAVTAVRVAPAAWIPALPVPDMARRRASASSRPLCLVLFAVCAMVNPVPTMPAFAFAWVTRERTARPAGSRSSANQERPSYTTKAEPWLWV